MTLGGRIQLSRKKKGYSQEDLANLLGVSRQSVQKWETDQSSPEIAKLVKLSEILDVSLDYLIKGEDDVVEVIEESDASVEPVIVATPQSVPTRTVDRNILYSFKYQSGGLLITPNNKKIDASFKIEGGTLYSRYNGFNWPFALLGIIFTPVAGILMGLFIPHKWNSQLFVSSIKGIQIYSDTIELTTYEGIYKFKPRDFSTWANFFNDFSRLLDPKLAKGNELKLKKEQEAEAARTAAAAAEEARKEAERKRQLELKRKLDLMRTPRILKIQTLWNTFDNSEYVPDDKNKSHSKANYLINKIRSAANEQEADSYVEEYRTFNKQFKINHEYYVKRKKRNTKITLGVISGIVATALAIVGVTFGVKARIRTEINNAYENDYNNSLQLMYGGKYNEAKESFKNVVGFKDADKKIKVCDALIYLTNAKNDSKYDIKTGINMIIDAGETARVSYTSEANLNLVYSDNTYSQEITTKNYTFKDPGTKLGYTFSKWVLSDVFYRDNHSYLTLTSKWTLDNYRIYYELDGGVNNVLNPSQYTVEDSVVLYNPSKVGYSFIGWYDKGGNKVTGIKKGSVGTVTFIARWNANSYKLSVDSNNSNRGTVEGSGTYKCDETVTINATSNIGYEFKGWYRNGNKISSSSKFSFKMPAENLTYVGQFDIVKYKINYVLNGGSQNNDNPSEYTVETDTIELKAPTRQFYNFEGWYDDKGDLVELIEKGRTGDLTLYASWSSTKYLLDIQIIGGQELDAVSGIGEYSWGTNVLVKAQPYDDNKFLGWYSNEECTELISNELECEINMPKNNLIIFAKFKSSNQINNERELGKLPKLLSADYLTYGMYPQSVVSNAETIDSLDKISNLADKDGFVLFNGNYYKKKTAEFWGGLVDSTFSDGSSIVSGKSYWFKVEPIKWRVLSNVGCFYVMTNSILDTHRFDPSSNSYGGSEIREWIDSTFKCNMFSKSLHFDKAIYTQSNPLSLMSVSELSDSRYGFNGVGYMDSKRSLEMTDYALASYCNGTYWTSTPYDGSSSLVQYVYANKGEFNKTWSYAREKGVVVSTRFKTSCLDLY